MKFLIFTLLILTVSCCKSQQSKSGSIDSSKVEQKIDIPFHKSYEIDIKSLDSGFLKFSLYSDYYKVSLLNDSITTANIKAVDDFVAKHILLLDKEKVVIIGNPDLIYPTFKDIKKLLKKYEIYTFKFAKLSK